LKFFSLSPMYLSYRVLEVRIAGGVAAPHALRSGPVVVVQRKIRRCLTHQLLGAFRLDGLEHDQRVVRANEQFEIGECVGRRHDTP
jgi:hypothetical protein